MEQIVQQGCVDCADKNADITTIGLCNVRNCATTYPKGSPLKFFYTDEPIRVRHDINIPVVNSTMTWRLLSVKVGTEDNGYVDITTATKVHALSGHAIYDVLAT